jgi:hypothetical protein
MRIVIMALVMSACADIGMRPEIGVTQPGVADPATGLCMKADPTTVVFDGAIDPEQRTPTVVTLSTKDECVEPFAHIELVDLDDPVGAFAIAMADPPLEVTPDQDVPLDVSFIATDPGVYEGQVVVFGMGAFGEATVTVQLYAEIAAE